MARTVGSAAEDTRRRILDATTELFHERGYASTSIRHITERLGMTKGALYYHFSSKEELLLAIVAPLLEALTTFVGALREAGTVGPEQVRELVDILDANAPLVRSLGSDPAVTRAKLEGRGITAPFMELERSISNRWQVSAGYSWQKAEITKTTASAPAGLDVPLVPKHSFSLWNRYDVSDTLGLGLGVIARSKSYASISNNVKLPGYARVDAAAYYKLMRGIEAQINVENIFGADYFPTAHSDNNIAPGGPRAVKAQLRFGF